MEQISWKKVEANVSYVSKIIWKIDETGSRDNANIKSLLLDVNMFIKHVMNDVTENGVTKDILYLNQ